MNTTKNAGCTAQDDRDLVTRMKAGDMSAFRELVVRHQPRALVVAKAVLRNDADAADVVQDAFLRVYKGIATFEGESSFYTWFYRIIKNLAVDVLRHPGRTSVEMDEGMECHESNVVEKGAAKERMAEIRRAMAALTPDHRAAFRMREIEGMTYEEIAVEMGVNVGTVMSRIYYARQKLHAALRAPGAVPTAMREVA